MTEPRIKAFRLWERESKNGRRYFAGFIGGLGIVMFKDEQAEPREGVIAEWQVYFTEREPRAGAASPEPQRRSRRAEPEVDAGRPFNDDIGRGDHE